MGVVKGATSNVVLLSNNGNLTRQILTTDDGLYPPYAIFFDKQTRHLLVANHNKTALLYNIT